MLSFFGKKHFLVDYLTGFRDIHNHILPGIDDGAKNTKESVALLQALHNYGITNHISTPHIMHHYYDNNKTSINKAYKDLIKAIEKANLSTFFKLEYAAEHMVDDNFENLLEQEQVLPLGKNHVLIEMSYLQPSLNFEVAAKKILAKQHFPILAHPERYLYLQKDAHKYRVYKNMGIKFQLNMLSLSGYYGKEVHKAALFLLQQNYYDFIGTDVHNLAQAKGLETCTIAPKHLSIIQEIIDNNNFL